MSAKFQLFTMHHVGLVRFPVKIVEFIHILKRKLQTFEAWNCSTYEWPLGKNMIARKNNAGRTS